MNQEIIDISRRLEIELTKSLKQIIKDKDLIDTGKMLNETEAKIVFFGDDDFKINILSTEYFTFVDAKNDILNEALKNNDVDYLIGELISAIILQHI